MDSIDQQVLGQLQRWLDQGSACYLCTIVRAIGSSPRPVGSLLAVGPGVQVSGNLTGVLESLVLMIVRGISTGSVASGREKQPDNASISKTSIHRVIFVISCPFTISLYLLLISNYFLYSPNEP